MAHEETHSLLFQSGTASVHPELMLSAVLHLMSHYTAHQQDAQECPRLASVIERHLTALADLPNLAPVLQATCRQLSEEWMQIVERGMRQRQRPGFFTRIAPLRGI